MIEYRQWFAQITGLDQEPHDWQTELAATKTCTDRLIRIPTGMGKTEGVLCAWLWHAIEYRQSAWPRRLVWCLPMRVLVEQTVDRATQMIDCWARRTGRDDKPLVHILMGGEDCDKWFIEPEKSVILVGTQDMLLSRALNRGYASGRARWPVEFGLLNHDALWVIDEIQLMDVGLATSAQLQAFRQSDIENGLRPCRTWWMSATLQAEWLKSIDTIHAYTDWIREPCEIPPNKRAGGLWEIAKPISTDSISEQDASTFATRVLSEHAATEAKEYGKITLVVCNTVDRACKTHEALETAGRTDGLELVHGRFRPADRAAWRKRFLSRSACTSGVDRIIVATQVVEAGVDISGGCLISELAPWPSLVQRFGRCARYGGRGKVLVVDRGQDEKSARPYEPESLNSAWEVLQTLSDVGVAALEAFEDNLNDDARENLYPYQPAHLLMRDEFDELFDTTPDLTGADIDISRFIRSGDERDLQVFWREIPKKVAPRTSHQPYRDELCSVPFLVARNWLCGKETKTNRKPRLRGSVRSWIWDWIDGEWMPARRELLVPGRVVCVAADCGGYTLTEGFSPDSTKSVPIVPPVKVTTDALLLKQADDQQDGEPLSFSEWKTISFHAAEVAECVSAMCTTLNLPDDITRILTLAARWHDVGKSHPAFQGKIRDAERESRPDRHDLAKGPEDAWLKPPGKYLFPDDSEERPAFRHELASALALFSVLQQYTPTHPALLGAWTEAFETMGHPLPKASRTDPTDDIQAILDCTADEFDLLAYIVASHHGKVRVALHAAPADQNYHPAADDHHGLPIRGVRSGDSLPAIKITSNGSLLPELPLTLEPAAMGLSFETGASWRERTQRLMQRHGPATLGFLEAILRAADVRASRLKTEDPVFTKEVSA